MLYFPTRRTTGFDLFSIWSAITKGSINVVSGMSLLVSYVLRVLIDSVKMACDSFVPAFFKILVISPTLLTYSMVQSPSWGANWFAASQEIPRILLNPKVHYRIHKRPPPVSILGQPSLVHIPTSHHLEIHPNIIHPSTPRSPQSSLSLRFPYQDPTRPLFSPIRATCPAHLIPLDFSTTLTSTKLL